MEPYSDSTSSHARSVCSGLRETCRMQACAGSAYLESSAQQNMGSLNVKELLPGDRKRQFSSVLGFGPVRRRPEIDALRGVFLVWMTLAHLPTHLSDFVDEPFGFVSSAEGFVFLSALLVARLYSGRR